MRKVVLYIATTIDGYIADKDGKIDFLKPFETMEDLKPYYSNFMRNVDTTIMGRKTYEQLINELSPEVWPYEEQMSYIYTKEEINKANIKSTQEDPNDLVKRLKQESGKDIFLIGGAHTAQEFMKDDLIDEYKVFVMPVALESGIKLFDPKRFPKIKIENVERIGDVNFITYVRG